MPGYRSEKTRTAKTATALLGCVALVACATLLRQPIEQTRTRLSLQQSAPGIGGLKLPPDIAFAQASLGTFRALATTVLWSRASRLQREGNYFESMRLADWITRLQPRFSKVWEFYAANMTYNISVATRTPRERWLWVNSGITLLRNRGIPLNPGKANLYAELSRFFFDKIGGTNDETHLYYKLRLAEEWHDLLGPPRLAAHGRKPTGFALLQMPTLATSSLQTAGRHSKNCRKTPKKRRGCSGNSDSWTSSPDGSCSPAWLHMKPKRNSLLWRKKRLPAMMHSVNGSIKTGGQHPGRSWSPCSGRRYWKMTTGWIQPGCSG